MPSFKSGVLGVGALALALLLRSDGAEAIRPVNPQVVKLAAKKATRTAGHAKRATPTFPLYNFTQPLDHFSDTGFTFQQRYWVSDRHYKPGGPVIVFEAGEGPGDERMPILDTGIIDILANATNGLGIVLEHRYYGKSVPVLNFTTDSLRWLNNEQAAADSANFIDNVTIPGIKGDITAPGTPWIYYGGSYGGARAAHMRVLYPDIVFGSISSSGVTHATVVDWRYFDIIRQYAPQDCVARIVQTVDEVDTLLTRNNHTRNAIKAVFGLSGISYDPDFASLLSSPLGAWQNRNWDPAIDDPSFFDFCEALGPLDNATVTTHGVTISNATAQYANYINQTISLDCPVAQQDECFGSITDPESFSQTDLSQTWRLWNFQVCTQWGFLMTPPPDPATPRIISKLLTKEYAHLTCTLSYPPGEHFAIPAWPNVEDVNKLGGYNIAYDRLAIIDGEDDPWRGDTPHSPDPRAHNRTDTTIRPFKLIPTAVHHWDENGLADPSAEPDFIQTIHHQEVTFVTEWLKGFKPPSAH
ncbi:peptidase S28 [Dichomitus squalens]|uniref:Peptidase S28 n=1 Tax=Dichomitus squalens TaxID=114155 RepID=A0A4Q9PPH1_9APHY|nr:peptidase S28 [Dichomitus squalens]